MPNHPSSRPFPPGKSRLVSFLLFAMLLFVVSTSSAAGESVSGDGEEEKAIRKAIQAYLHGTSFNDTELIQSAFYDDARLFLSHPEREIYILPIGGYLEFFADKEKGKANGREGEILAVDRSGDIATAKAEIRIPARGARYVDLFLLKKISGEWKIISKAATQTD